MFKRNLIKNKKKDDRDDDDDDDGSGLKVSQVCGI